jgi:hypothetical protein
MTFPDADICVIGEMLESGQGMLFDSVHPHETRFLTFPLEMIVPREIPEGDDNGDDIEEELYFRACADLPYGRNRPDRE